MKRTLRIASVFVAMALAFAGCKEAPDDDDDKLSAPKVGSAKDLAASGGTLPASETAAVELYNDASDVMSSFVRGEIRANASVRTSQETIRPLVATIGEDDDDDRNIDETTPISIDESVGGGTVKFTGNIRTKMSTPDIDYENLKTNTTYSMYTYSQVAEIDGTITNVTIADNGENYTFTGTTKNEGTSNAKISLKTGSKQDFSDSKISVTAEFALAFGNAFSVKREKDGAGAKFIITCAANYGPKSWVFGLDEDSEAYEAFGNNLRDYLLGQEATLTVYDDSNEERYKIKITGQEALSTSILY